MRLIDADLLKDKIVWLPHVNGIPATVNHNRPLIDITQAIEAINEQLTAYDVDKVVEEIREQNGICNGCGADEDRKCSIEKIISTVKGGIQ